MNFIKKHISIFVALIVIVLMVVGLLVLKNIFYKEENKAIYGNRLEGRENIIISKETINKVKTELSENTTKVDVRIAGRIIYINVKVNPDTTKETARSLADKAVAVFSDIEKSYYDIQILIDNDSNQEQFPIIGYKHHTKTAISWTKDR